MKPSKRRKIYDFDGNDSIFTFRKDLVLLLFPNLTESETKEKVKRYSNEINLYLSDLKDLLGNIRFVAIHSLFKRYFQRDQHTSKIHMIEALLDKFYEEESAFEKRDFEQTMILDLQSNRQHQDDLNFLKMKGIVVPVEMIREILSFLPRNGNILFSVGFICKSIYYHLLSSWDSILIEKKNVFNFSLVVLNSVQKVTFIERRTNSDCNFTCSELNYLFSMFNPNKLEEIEICNTLPRSIEFLRVFKTSVERNEKNKKLMKGIRTLSFLTRKELKERYDGLFNEYDQIVHSYSNQLTKFKSVEAFFPLIFPRVKNMIFPFSPSFFYSSTTLESLVLRDPDKGWTQGSFHMVLHILEGIPKTLRHLFLHCIAYWDILNSLPNLVSLSIVIQNPNINSFFNPSSNKEHSKLQKLEITEKSRYKVSIHSHKGNTEPGKIVGLFLPSEGGYSCICHFSSLKEFSFASISRRAFLDIPSLEIFFKHIFPAVTRFKMVVSNSPKTGNNEKDYVSRLIKEGFTKSLFDHVINAMNRQFEVFDMTFVEVDKAKGSSFLQVIFCSKTRELKILFLGQEFNLRRSSRRSRGSKSSNNIRGEQKFSRNVLLFGSIISDIKKFLDSQNEFGRQNAINRIVIVKDESNDLTRMDEEIGDEIGCFKLKERYRNLVEIKKPLSLWFDFGRGEVHETEKLFDHQMFLVE